MLRVLISLDLSKAFVLTIMAWFKNLDLHLVFLELLLGLYSYIWRILLIWMECTRVCYFYGQGFRKIPSWDRFFLHYMYVNDLLQYIDSNICTVYQFAVDVFLLFDFLSLIWTLALNLLLNGRRIILWNSFKHCEFRSSDFLFENIIKCLNISIDVRLLFAKHVDHICSRVFYRVLVLC